MSEEVFVGIDVSKDALDVAVLPGGQKRPLLFTSFVYLA
jgi:hypothetical protein